MKMLALDRLVARAHSCKTSGFLVSFFLYELFYAIHTQQRFSLEILHRSYFFPQIIYTCSIDKLTVTGRGRLVAVSLSPTRAVLFMVSFIGEARIDRSIVPPPAKWGYKSE